MKDLFSGHATDYARYRPTYPPELFRWLVQQLSATDAAWDCGTGNGQVAAEISQYFKQVYATDISPQQMAQAPQLPNIVYQTASGEDSGLADASVDFVVVAQAVHWFQFDTFYKEVKRVVKTGGLLAIVGYNLMQVDAATDAIIQQFYSETLAGYWDPERRYLDEAYETIPFPFPEVAVPQFDMHTHWNVEQLIGYLHTWSAVKHYEKRNGDNPVNAIAPELVELWKSDSRTVSFPLLLRVGKC